MLEVIKSFKEDLIRGDVEYSFKSEEKDLFTPFISEDMQETCNVSSEEIKFDGDSKKKPLYRYNLNFEVNNGLMSGWKMTSLFGSFFNLTLNRMGEFWTLIHTQDQLYNY